MVLNRVVYGAQPCRLRCPNFRHRSFCMSSSRTGAPIGRGAGAAPQRPTAQQRTHKWTGRRSRRSGGFDEDVLSCTVKSELAEWWQGGWILDREFTWLLPASSRMIDAQWHMVCRALGATPGKKKSPLIGPSRLFRTADHDRE